MPTYKYRVCTGAASCYVQFITCTFTTHFHCTWTYSPRCIDRSIFSAKSTYAGVAGFETTSWPLAAGLLCLWGVAGTGGRQENGEGASQIIDVDTLYQNNGNSASTFSQTFKGKCIWVVERIGSIIIFYLSKLWKAKFFILCDLIFLVRLQGKFEIDHSWEWKG